MINKNLVKTFAFYYLPLLAWMGLIFYFSSLSGFGRQYSPDIYFYITRKGAHLIEFFILTILFIRIIKFYEIKNTKTYFASILFSLAYAFSDEVHQLFVIGREGKFFDIGIDLIGIILAVVLYKLFSRK